MAKTILTGQLFFFVVTVPADGLVTPVAPFTNMV